MLPAAAVELEVVEGSGADLLSDLFAVGHEFLAGGLDANEYRLLTSEVSSAVASGQGDDRASSCQAGLGSAGEILAGLLLEEVDGVHGSEVANDQEGSADQEDGDEKQFHERKLFGS